MKREKMNLRRRMKETLALALSVLMVLSVVNVPIRTEASPYTESQAAAIAPALVLPGETVTFDEYVRVSYYLTGNNITEFTYYNLSLTQVSETYQTGDVYYYTGTLTFPFVPEHGTEDAYVYRRASVDNEEFGYAVTYEAIPGYLLSFLDYYGSQTTLSDYYAINEFDSNGSSQGYDSNLTTLAALGSAGPDGLGEQIGWCTDNRYIKKETGDPEIFVAVGDSFKDHVSTYYGKLSANDRDGVVYFFPVYNYAETELTVSAEDIAVGETPSTPTIVETNRPTGMRDFTVGNVYRENSDHMPVGDPITGPITEPGNYCVEVIMEAAGETVLATDGSDMKYISERAFGAQTAYASFEAVNRASLTKNPSANDLTYTGEPQALVTAGESDDGTVVYSLTEEGEYSETIPTGTDAGDYSVWYMVQANEEDGIENSNPVKVDVTIKKAEIEVTAPVAKTLTYNGTYQELITRGSASMGTLLYNLANNGAGSESIPTAKDAGTYQVWYFVSLDEELAKNYYFEPASVNVTISPKTEVIEGVTAATGLVYDGTEQPLLVLSDDATEGLTFGFDEEEIFSGDIPTGLEAGEYTVYVKKYGDGENTEDSETGSFTVTIAKKEVGLAWGTTEFTYDGQTHQPTLTLTGVIDGDECTAVIEGEGTNAGTYTAEVTGLLENGEEPFNYKLPETVTKTFTIAKKEVGLTWGTSAFTYDGESHLPTVTVTGVVGEEKCTAVVEGEETNAGTYTAKVTGLLVNGEEAINYVLPTAVTKSFTIAKKEVGLTWGTTAFTYDGESHIPTVTVTGVVGEEKCTAVVEGEETNAGTYTAEVTGLLVNGEEAINYVLPTAVTKSFTIGKKEVGLTWDKTEFTYDGTEHCPKATATGLVTGDTCNVTVETVDGPAVNAGDYEATATGLSNDNYTLPATATVGFKIKSTPTGIEKAPSAKEGLVYTGSDQELVNPGVATKGGKIQYSLEENGTYSDTIPAKKDAGTYKVYYKAVAADGNHVDADGDSQFVEVTIAKKTVGLDWSNLEFTYDGSEHCPEATVTGLVTGDTCTVTVTGGQTDAGTYEATATGLSNDNYELPATVTKSFEIKKASASITKVPTAVGGLVYDGTSHALVTAGTANGGKIQYSLTETGTYTDAVPVGKNAGTYTVYYKLVGLNANYAAENADGQFVEATIAQKVVALDWQVTIGAYDGKERTVTATVAEEDLVVGDTCNVTVETIDGPAINAGNYTAKATALSNANYALPENVTQEFSIEKRDVFFSEKPVAKELTYTGAAQELVTKGKATEGGKIVYRLGDGEFSDTIPTGKAVGKYTVGVSVDATDNNHAGGSEYDEIEVTIAQKALTLTWSNTELTFNDKEQSPTATLNGVVGGDDVKVTVNEAKKEVGKYTATVTFSGTDIANYKLPTNTSVEFSIVKKEEPRKEKENGSATVTMGSFIYGGSATTPVVTSSTHDASKAAISYKASGAPDDAYSGTKPTGVGTYNVRAVLPENDKYKQCVAVGTFTISYLPVPEGAYEITGEKGNDGWFTSEVKLTPAAGYEISVGDRTSFRTGSVTLSEQMTGTTFYIRKTETGEQTAGVTIAAMQIDTDAPTIEMEENNVYFCDEEGKLLAVANDKNLDKVYVNGVEVPLTDDGNGTKTFDLPVDKKKQSVNVKVVDKAGNEKSMVVITAPAWMKSGVVGDGEYYLEPKNAYGTPKEGSCTLEGDASTYMPGIKFYAKKEGFHTFHVNH